MYLRKYQFIKKKYDNKKYWKLNFLQKRFSKEILHVSYKVMDLQKTAKTVMMKIDEK